MTYKRLTVLATVAASACAGLVSLGTATAAPPAPSPLKFTTAHHQTWYLYGKRAYADSEAYLEAVGSNFELWSHRASWHDKITTQLRRGGTTTDLPAGTMKDFNGLPGFFDLTLTDAKGKTVMHRHPTVCLDGDTTQRAEPGGAAHSKYPWGCPSNIFTEGSIQGIARGWVSSVPLFGYRGVKIAKGDYTMTLSIAPKYQQLFGLTGTTSHTVDVTVKKDKRGGVGVGTRPVPTSRTAPAGSSTNVQPSPKLNPSQRLQAPPANGPKPDLEALPAWGIDVAKNGNYLNFSATVWNGGNSPLVVQGFHRGTPKELTSYQYFYDTDGTQVGYVQAGHMHWDADPSHHHWHFEDFAEYTLLDANKQTVVKSRKDGFCLANTDAIDYTVDGANWNPDNTDLQTACGELDSPSVSEVLASGSGDTYEQYRAGQSFSLKDLKNGIYYISVTANPNHVLTEQSTDNNSALRKIKIGGTADHRTVHVYKKGDISG